MQDVSPTLVNK